MRIGRVVPDFSAHTTEGPIHFHKWTEQSWVALFTQSAGANPAGLKHVSQHAYKFHKNSVKILAVSSEILSKEVISTCSFPIVYDKRQDLAVLLGLKKNDCNEELSLYILGSDHKLKLSMNFPASTARDITDEVLQVVDSLRYIESLPKVPSNCLAQLCQCDGLDVKSHEHRLRCAFHDSNKKKEEDEQPTTLSDFYSVQLTHYDKMWV